MYTPQVSAEKDKEKQVAQGIATVIVIVLCVFLFRWCSAPSKHPEGIASTSSIETSHWQENDAKQPGRREFVEKLIAQGVFRKVDFQTNGATIWVDSAFYALEFDAKKNFCDVVLGYAVTQSRNEYITVDLKDIISGKTVGEDNIFGLKMK